MYLQNLTNPLCKPSIPVIILIMDMCLNFNAICSALTQAQLCGQLIHYRMNNTVS